MWFSSQAKLINEQKFDQYGKFRICGGGKDVMCITIQFPFIIHAIFTTYLLTLHFKSVFCIIQIIFPILFRLV